MFSELSMCSDLHWINQVNILQLMLNYSRFILQILTQNFALAHLLFLSSEAAQVRKEYDELSKKLSNMQSRISSLSKKLKQDFG